jgi:gluconolactonase
MGHLLIRHRIRSIFRFPVSPYAFRGLCMLCGLAGGSAFAQDYGFAQGDVPVSIADKGAKVLPVLIAHPTTGKALGHCDGVAADMQGNVYVSEPAAHSIYKINPQGQASVFYSGHADSPNGLEIDNQGRLYACVKDAILRFSADGAPTGVPETFSASGNGIAFQTLDDITLGSDGSLYVSNFSAGKTVFRVGADGKATAATAAVANPDGVEWLEEKKILYVSDRNATTTWQFDVAADGALSNKRGYVTDIPGAAGLTMDEKEDVYISGFSQGSVHLYSPGKKDPFLGHIIVKGSPTATGNNANQCFGGTDFKTLYVTGNGGLFKIQLNVKGRRRPGSATFIRPLPAARDRASAYGAALRSPGSSLVIFWQGARHILSGRALRE